MASSLDEFPGYSFDFDFIDIGYLFTPGKTGNGIVLTLLISMEAVNMCHLETC